MSLSCENKVEYNLSLVLYIYINILSVLPTGRGPLPEAVVVEIIV